MNQTMKAVLIDKPIKGADVELSEVSIPQVQPGWVLVKVKGLYNKCCGSPPSRVGRIATFIFMHNKRHGKHLL